MKTIATLLILCSVTLSGCTTVPPVPEEKRVLVFGASGRIGSYIVEEALLRDNQVTGVSRRAENLQQKHPDIDVEQADILDRVRLKQLLSQFNNVVVSVGGKPTSSDAEKYIANTAAHSLIEVLSELGSSGPRVIFVGNVYTLKTPAGDTLLEKAQGHRNYPMFAGHQLALDAFRASNGIRWTIASPPNGLRLKGRTGKVRWSENNLLLDSDGKFASISPADFAWGILEELEQQRFVGKLYTVAR